MTTTINTGMSDQIHELTVEEMNVVTGGVIGIIVGAFSAAHVLSDLTGGATFENWQQMGRNL
jgi:hypothetical protein